MIVVVTGRAEEISRPADPKPLDDYKYCYENETHMKIVLNRNSNTMTDKKCLSIVLDYQNCRWQVIEWVKYQNKATLRLWSSPSIDFKLKVENNLHRWVESSCKLEWNRTSEDFWTCLDCDENWQSENTSQLNWVNTVKQQHFRSELPGRERDKTDRLVEKILVCWDFPV